MRCKILAGLAVVIPALAQAAAQEAPARVASGELEWVEMIPGVEFANAKGDWAAGAHGKFVRFQPGAFVPMHRHSGTYHGVMISGRLTNPYEGDVSPAAMEPGDFWSVPGEAAHENKCVSDVPCLFYTHSDGAWDVEMAEQQ